MHTIFVVFKKEFKDILRDRRALMTIGLISILAGPVILLMISNMLAGFEARAERRVIVVHGIEHAPSLATYLKRQTIFIENAPDNYEALIKAGQLLDPVLAIPEGFEKNWQTGTPQTIELITNSAKSRINAGVGRVIRWVSGFEHDRLVVVYAERGFATGASNFFNIETIDLASAKAQSAKIFSLLPYFLVMAALYGVWGSALDTTVGERERGTLESLLVIPHPTWQMMIGKWCAVSMVGALVASLAVISFIPAQALMQSETLKVMFSFSWYEVAICLLVVLPLAGLFAALLMLVGTIAKSTRQAQANASVVLLISTFIPMFSMFDGADSAAQRWAPIVAHHHHIVTLFQGNPSDFIGIAMLNLATIVLTLLLLAIAIKRVRLQAP